MTTINTTITAKEAYEIALNDPIARIINKSSFEEIIKTHANYALSYAENVIKGRWVEGEEIIKTNANTAYGYARDVIRGRWAEGEEIIKTCPYRAYDYAKDVIKGAWPECEKIIATNPRLACDYCYNVTQKRCPTIEKYIIEKRLNLVFYRRDAFYNYNESDRGIKNHFISQGSEAPAKHIQEAIKCYYYVVDNIKGRWIEAEDIIKQFDTAWSMYQDFLETLPLTDDEWAEKVRNECQSILSSK